MAQSRAHAVDLDDVGVREARDGQGLAAEALHVALIQREPRAQHLDRHRTGQIQLCGQVHHGHAAAAQLALQAQAVEDGPRPDGNGSEGPPPATHFDQPQAARQLPSGPFRHLGEKGLGVRTQALGQAFRVLGHQGIETVVEGFGVHRDPERRTPKDSSSESEIFPSSPACQACRARR
jgi:hypothetical protein